MATCRAIVAIALRKIGVLGAGREPRTSDATDALEALQGLYGSWIASGAFGRLREVVPTGTHYTPQGSERILRLGAELLTVTLPELVSSGWTYDYGRERLGGNTGTIITVQTIGDDVIVNVEAAQPIGNATPPRDGQAVVIVSPDQGHAALQAWLYDGTAKRWQNTAALQMDHEAPRSEADRQGLAACLAVELADQYAADLQPGTLAQAARYKQAMTIGYGFERPETAGVYF